jgi:hypothetical protein
MAGSEGGTAAQTAVDAHPDATDKLVWDAWTSWRSTSLETFTDYLGKTGEQGSDDRLTWLLREFPQRKNLLASPRPIVLY